jgi:SAM-dependent methyltransferase
VTALYAEDLAFIHASAYTSLARDAAPALVARIRSSVTTRAFVDAGFDVTGVEPSPSLIAAAREAAPGARFIQASVYDVELPACDAIVALGEPLSYHAPDRDGAALVARFIAGASRALAPGGLLAFDVIVAEGPPLDARGWQSGDDWAVLAATEEDRDARRLVRHIETFRRVGESYRRAREDHHVQLFPEGDVRGWLEGAGFDVEVATAYGPAELLPRRLAFFARKPS